MTKDNFKQKCYAFIKTFFQRIDNDKLIKADFSLSNSACHFNAVAAVRSGRADAVWLVWGGESKGCIHFINSKSGKFFDETWHDYENQNYYIIRKVRSDEYEDIYNALCDAKKSLIALCGNTIERYRASKHLHDWL